MSNNQSENVGSQQDDRDDRLENLGKNFSAFALIIWFIPGLALFGSILINPIYNRINPDLSDTELEKIEKIVDRKVSRNTDLVNILLFVLTALPIVGNFYFWLLYKSVRSGMVEDSLKELNPKIKEEVNDKLPTELNEILKEDDTIRTGVEAVLKSESLDQSIKEKLLKLLDLNDCEIKDKLLEIIKHDSIQESIDEIIYAVIMEDINKLIEKIDELSRKIDVNKKGIIDSLKSRIESIDKNQNQENIVNQVQQELNKFTQEIKQLKDESSRADGYKDEADDLFVQGNYNEAIISYVWASLYQQDNRYVWYKIAEAHRQLKEYKSAISYFNKVIKSDKGEGEDKNKYPYAYFYKAICNVAEKQEHEAIESLKKAISLKPDELKVKAKEKESAFDSIKNPYYKACFYALIDSAEEALAELEEAVNKKPEYKEKAKTESAFDSIRDNDKFTELIE